MKNIQKIVMWLLVFSLIGNAFAWWLDEDLNPSDFIDNEVNSTIKEIDKAIVEDKDLTQYIYYFSQTCSHCQKVNKFFVDNKIDEKFDLIKKDIWVFEASQELVKVREAIWLDPLSLSVPFLVYKEKGKYKYLWGDQPIIDFFQAKLDKYYPQSNKDENNNNSDTNLQDDINNTDNSNNTDEDDVEDNDKQNQDLLLYFIISWLVVLLGGWSYIILKKK